MTDNVMLVTLLTLAAASEVPGAATETVTVADGYG